MWTRTYAIWPQQVASLRSQPSPFCEASRWMRFTEACLLKTENNMTTLSEPLVTPKYGKWRQLVLGLICMAAISSPQYVWTLLTKPGRQTWRRSARIAGHLLATDHPADLLFPFQGRLVEKFGPRRLIAIGTVMAGMSWVLSAQVNGRQRSGWFMAAWAASGPGSSTSALSA